MSEGVEASGKTLDEAIEKALSLLGLERDQVHIEVLSTCLLYTSDAADE